MPWRYEREREAEALSSRSGCGVTLQGWSQRCGKLSLHMGSFCLRSCSNVAGDLVFAHTAEWHRLCSDLIYICERFLCLPCQAITRLIDAMIASSS